MTTFLIILGIIILLGLSNFVMYKILKASTALRLLAIVGLILLLLGIYSLPYITISGTAILIILALILITGFIIFLLSKFITPEVVKILIVLSVVILLFSIFLVSFTTFKSDNENKKMIVRKASVGKFFEGKNINRFNSGSSMKELDSITAQINKGYNFTKNRDMSPNDLSLLNKRNKIGG